MALDVGLRNITLATMATTFLVGCSYIPGLAKDEETQQRRQSMVANLEVPPAFTAPDPRQQLVIPEIVSARAQAAQGERRAGLLQATADVRFEGPPEARYLVVSHAPDDVWPRLQLFLQEEGYTIRRIEPAIGLMETDWTGMSESQPGSGGIMRFLRVARDWLFKPDYLERVRLRIEQGEDANQTRVFVATQRMDLEGDEPLVTGGEVTSFKYGSARPAPEMDVEVLGRLAAYLSGKTEAESRAMLAANFQPRAQVIYEEKEYYIATSQSYPRTWNRTGLALDRLGFDPVSRDENKGIIVVTHNRPQDLYEGIAIRGVSIDRQADISVQMTVKLQPQRDGGTQLRVEDITVTGGELPRFDVIVLERINEQLR